MTKGSRSHVHSAQGERGRDETLIKQVSAKQDYSRRNVKGGGRLAYDRRRTTAEARSFSLPQAKVGLFEQSYSCGTQLLVPAGSAMHAN
eukprot:5967193-Pyramimonas_sp.AAC.1